MARAIGSTANHTCERQDARQLNKFHTTLPLRTIETGRPLIRRTAGYPQTERHLRLRREWHACELRLAVPHTGHEANPERLADRARQLSCLYRWGVGQHLSGREGGIALWDVNPFQNSINDETVSSVALQSDGSIVVAGSIQPPGETTRTQWAVTRLLGDCAGALEEEVLADADEDWKLSDGEFDLLVDLLSLDLEATA